MDIFNLGLGVVLNLINQILDQAYAGMKWYGAVGFITGIVIYFVGLRIKLFQRKKKSLRLLTGFYSLFLPILLGAYGVVWGGLHHSHQEFVAAVPDSVTPMTKISYTGYQFFVTQNWNSIERQSIPFKETVYDFTAGIQFEPYMDDWMENQKVELANQMAPMTTRWGIESIVESAMTYKNEDQPTGMSEEEYSQKAFIMAQKADIYNYPDDFWTQVDTATVSRIDGYFTLLNWQAFGIFVVLLMLPVIEVLLNWRKR